MVAASPTVPNLTAEPARRLTDPGCGCKGRQVGQVPAYGGEGEFLIVDRLIDHEARVSVGAAEIVIVDLLSGRRLDQGRRHAERGVTPDRDNVVAELRHESGRPHPGWSSTVTVGTQHDRST